MATVLNASVPFEIDSKRFYMPGPVVVSTCPHCGHAHQHDLRHSYLGYPSANRPFGLDLYCEECEAEWTVTCVLRVALEVVPEAPPLPLVAEPSAPAACEPTPMEQLVDLLDSANAYVTVDFERDHTKPCFNCGTTIAPRRLVRVGMWERKVGNRGRAASPIERPICAACEG